MNGLWTYYAVRHWFIWIALMLCIAGPAMAAVVFAVNQSDRTFATNGVEVAATVTDKSRFRTQSGWTNKVVYRYADSNGTTHDGEGTIPDGPWATTAVGETLAVKYLANDPAKSRPAVVEPSDVPFAMIGFVFAGVFTTIGVIGMLFSLSDITSTLRLLRTGRVATARITELIAEHGVIVYEYAGTNGEAVEGRLQAGYIGDASQPGDTFRVVVDPAKPQRHEIDRRDVRADG